MRPEDQRKAGVHYAVVPRTLVFLTRADQVLLLRGAPGKPLWAGKLNGLGGHLEPGETPLQSARREVLEEAGLQVDTLILRAVVHITMPVPPGIILFVFVGEVSRSELVASAEGEPLWVQRSALSTLPLVEDLPHLLPRVLDPGPLTFAHYCFTDSGLEISFDPQPGVG